MFYRMLKIWKLYVPTLNTFIYVVKKKLGQKDVYSFNDTMKKLQWPTTWPLTVQDGLLT